MMRAGCTSYMGIGENFSYPLLKEFPQRGEGCAMKNQIFYIVGVFVLISFVFLGTGCRGPQMVAMSVPAHNEYTAVDVRSLSDLPPKMVSTEDLAVVSGPINQFDGDATFFTPPSKFNYMRWPVKEWDVKLPSGDWRRVTKWYVPSRNMYQKYVWTVIGRDYCGRSIFGWTPVGIPIEEDLVTMPDPSTLKPPKLY